MGKGSKRSAAPQVGGAYTEQDIAAYQAELMGAPLAQSKAIPYAIGLERAIMPELQSYYFDTLGSSVGSLRNMYGSLQGQALESQGQYGRGLVGMYGGMGAMATDAAVAGLGGDAQRNYNIMQQQAADELALGAGLSQQETDVALGAARAAAQARGLQFSRQGGDLEVLNTYNMGLQRQAQRRQYAGEALKAAQGMQGYGAQAYLAPAMEGSAIYSIPGMISGAEGAMGGYGPRTLQSESQYMADLRTARLQGQAAANQANATRSAGMMSGLTTLGAAAIMKFCWVAREVYGEENPKWLQFREWVLAFSPDWFFNLYMKHGADFAEFISNKPLLKRAVRFVMDIILKNHLNRISSYA